MEKKASELRSGTIEILSRGFFWNSWQLHTVELKPTKFFAFLGKEATPSVTVEGTDIKTIKDGESSNQFNVVTKTGFKKKKS